MVWIMNFYFLEVFKNKVLFIVGKKNVWGGGLVWIGFLVCWFLLKRDVLNDVCFYLKIILSILYE